MKTKKTAETGAKKSYHYTGKVSLIDIDFDGNGVMRLEPDADNYNGEHYHEGSGELIQVNIYDKDGFKMVSVVRDEDMRRIYSTMLSGRDPELSFLCNGVMNRPESRIHADQILVIFGSQNQHTLSIAQDYGEVDQCREQRVGYGALFSLTITETP